MVIDVSKKSTVSIFRVKNVQQIIIVLSFTFVKISDLELRLLPYKV